MGKDPAFLFYPNDWLGGTLGMTFEEKGAYLELLMLQFNRGHMTGHMIGQIVGQLWDKIRCKFEEDEQGLFYNLRLELEVEKRRNYVESRKNNMSGKNQYSDKSGHTTTHTTSHMDGHTVGRMENENRNENIDDNGDINKGDARGKRERKSFIKPTPMEIKAYCSERTNTVDPDKFFDFYESNGWMVGRNKMKDWKASVRTWEKNSGQSGLSKSEQDALKGWGING